MRQPVIIFILIFLSVNLCGQTSYSGYIDKYPIELVTNIYSDGVVNAFYVYTKFDEPIRIDGTLNSGLLTLIEKDKFEKAKATFVFKNFNPEDNRIQGIWKDSNSDSVLKITLTRSVDIGYGDTLEWKSKELLQPVSLRDAYFKIIVLKNAVSFYATVTGLKIIEKKTDKVIQQIKLDCQLFGLNNIAIGDYNFDGLTDFSVFEQSYAGPNTSSRYFLFDPNKSTYVESTFEGTSLEFDQKNKRIYEHSQCCAGRSKTIAEYEVVTNKMILLNKTCLEYDDKTDDYKKVTCE